MVPELNSGLAEKERYIRGMFKWLFTKRQFQRVDDCYTMHRAALWMKLRTAITQQQSTGNSVWLIAHFPDVFETVQRGLGEWRMDYQIITQPTTPEEVVARSSKSPAQIQLALAELLVPADTIAAQSQSVSLSMIGLERHPLIFQEHQLETFARAVPCPVRFGYYLAINDPVIREVVNEGMIEILKQLGLQDHELITSNMITRRLHTVLARRATLADRNLQADSAAEWLALKRGQDG